MGIKRLSQSAVGTGAGTLLYTVPTSYRTNVTNIDVANTTSAPVNFTLYLVNSGGSVAAANMLFPTVSVPANTMIQWTGLQQITAGAFIQAIGSATGITVNITGDEVRE